MCNATAATTASSRRRSSSRRCSASSRRSSKHSATGGAQAFHVSPNLYRPASAGATLRKDAAGTSQGTMAEMIHSYHCRGGGVADRRNLMKFSQAEGARLQQDAKAGQSRAPTPERTAPRADLTKTALAAQTFAERMHQYNARSGSAERRNLMTFSRSNMRRSSVASNSTLPSVRRSCSSSRATSTACSSRTSSKATSAAPEMTMARAPSDGAASAAAAAEEPGALGPQERLRRHAQEALRHSF